MLYKQVVATAGDFFSFRNEKIRIWGKLIPARDAIMLNLNEFMLVRDDVIPASNEVMPTENDVILT